MKRILLVLLLASTPLLAGKLVQVRSAGVYLEEGLTTEQSTKAVKLAMAAYHWYPVAEETGRIHARLEIRSHVVEIEILIEGRKVNISYLDSENMKYKEKNGTPHIHGAYKRWISTLLRESKRQALRNLGKHEEAERIKDPRRW